MATTLKGKHIIVGISGGIAAYKAPLLVRLLVKAGAEVRCAVTEHALQFVTELTLETVSGNQVYTELFDRRNPHTTEHISLKDWGDLMVVAPASANIIGKIACGIADDALSTLLLSFRKPLFVCPAMNSQMLESPAYRRNADTLHRDGVIRHIGLSTHNPAMAGRAVETGFVEMILFSINPAFDMHPATENLDDLLSGRFDPALSGIDPQRAMLYRLCEERDVGITVMKGFFGGALFD